MTRALSGPERNSRPDVSLGAPIKNRHKAARASAFSAANHARERPVGALTARTRHADAAVHTQASSGLVPCHPRPAAVAKVSSSPRGCACRLCQLGALPRKPAPAVRRAHLHAMTICRHCGALRAGPKGTAMPFRAPSAARMPPLDFLLADSACLAHCTDVAARAPLTECRSSD